MTMTEHGDRNKVAILGLGYVGLPLALAAAAAGHDVVGYDIAADRIADIRQGRSELVDLNHDQLTAQLAAGTLSVTGDPMDLAPCEIYVICLPTPLRDGSPDLSMVLSGVDTVADLVDPGDMVILESTTWPGTTRDVIAPRLALRSNLVPEADLHLVFSPERIDPGNREFPLSRIPKLVGGLTREASERAAAFYGTFLDTVHIVSGPSEAEMAKILENTYRHVNLALVNELAMLCSETGINLRECIDAASTKPFGFMPFYPGPGVGGHCIPVDPMYLIWHARQTGRSLQLVEAAEQINRSMPAHVVSRIVSVLNDTGQAVRGSTVLILGVSYKPDVADLRESSAVPIAERLRRLGAEVRWHDPLVRDPAELAGLRRETRLTGELLRESTLTLLHTPHAEYLRSGLLTAAPLLLDAHGVLRHRRLPSIFQL